MLNWFYVSKREYYDVIMLSLQTRIKKPFLLLDLTLELKLAKVPGLILAIMARNFLGLCF